MDDFPLSQVKKGQTLGPSDLAVTTVCVSLYKNCDFTVNMLMHCKHTKLNGKVNTLKEYENLVMHFYLNCYSRFAYKLKLL